MSVPGQASSFASDRRLVKAGFTDLRSSSARLSDISRTLALPLTDQSFHNLLLRLERVASPDTALASYTAILQAQPSLVPALTHFDDSSAQHVLNHDGPLQRLLSVLGASQAFGRLMASRPNLINAVITDEGFATHSCTLDQRDAAFHAADPSHGTPAERTDALRACYRRQLVAILAWDLTSDALQIQPHVSTALSDLAQSALRQALTIAREQNDPDHTCRFAVIAMGKLGARELNYVSDCDLIYVAEPADRATDRATAGTPTTTVTSADAVERVVTKIGIALQRICSDIIPDCFEPPLWQIDTALRPEGKAGPLVRTMSSFHAYYEKWADNWEFQALLKARPIAGDQKLCDDFSTLVNTYVWKAGARPGFVVSCQNMRRRVEETIPPALREREIKLGQGGLRDVEFTVQMLQLVHGRTDTSLRAHTATLPALSDLVAGGYISRQQGSRISRDYRFERVLEHRQQMWQLRRTHLFPDLGSGNGGCETPRHTDVEQISRQPDIRRLARSMQLSPVQLVEQFDHVRREVRRIHVDVYYRPLLPRIAGMSADEVTLSQAAASERYRSIGFADPSAAARLVTRLTRGATRAARINRILLPVMLEWLGQGQNPDMGLLQLSKLEDRFGHGSSYLGFLRDSRSAAQRLCRIISNSRYLGDALSQSIESVTWLGHDDQLRARTPESLETQCRSLEQRFASDQSGFATNLRALRRHEMERIGLGWMTGIDDVSSSVRAMSDVQDELIRSALRWAIADWSAQHEGRAPSASLVVFAMGRYGGRESNFSSDADLLCFYTPSQEADESSDPANDDVDPATCARQLLTSMRTLLDAPIGLEQGISLDFDLRPEGKSGPLIRSLSSAERYYTNAAQTWEHQSLLRCRFVAGDQKAADHFLKTVVDPLRYPAEGLSHGQIVAVRRLKARMETERLPRGVRPDQHLKLGPGGLSDVEWTVQLLQLQYAGSHPSLRTVHTLEALAEEEKAGLVSAQEAATLRSAWYCATAVRNACYLWSPSVTRANVLPDSVQDLSGVAACLPPAFDLQSTDLSHHDGQQLANTVLALMRRSRRVMEHLFYGYDK